jgi:hypothetical protein
MRSLKYIVQESGRNLRSGAGFAMHFSIIVDLYIGYTRRRRLL